MSFLLFVTFAVCAGIHADLWNLTREQMTNTIYQEKTISDIRESPDRQLFQSYCDILNLSKISDDGLRALTAIDKVACLVEPSIKWDSDLNRQTYSLNCGFHLTKESYLSDGSAIIFDCNDVEHVSAGELIKSDKGFYYLGYPRDHVGHIREHYCIVASFPEGEMHFSVNRFQLQQNWAACYYASDCRIFPDGVLNCSFEPALDVEEELFPHLTMEVKVKLVLACESKDICGSEKFKPIKSMLGVRSKFQVTLGTLMKDATYKLLIFENRLLYSARKTCPTIIEYHFPPLPSIVKKKICAEQKFIFKTEDPRELKTEFEYREKCRNMQRRFTQSNKASLRQPGFRLIRDARQILEQIEKGFEVKVSFEIIEEITSKSPIIWSPNRYRMYDCYSQGPSFSLNATGFRYFPAGALHSFEFPSFTQNLIQDRYCYSAQILEYQFKFSIDNFDVELNSEKCFYKIKCETRPGILMFTIVPTTTANFFKGRIGFHYSLIIEHHILLKCESPLICGSEEFWDEKILEGDEGTSTGVFEKLIGGANYSVELYESRVLYSANRTCPREILVEFPAVKFESHRRLCVSSVHLIPYGTDQIAYKLEDATITGSKDVTRIEKFRHLSDKELIESKLKCSSSIKKSSLEAEGAKEYLQETHCSVHCNDEDGYHVQCGYIMKNLSSIRNYKYADMALRYEGYDCYTNRLVTEGNFMTSLEKFAGIIEYHPKLDAFRCIYPGLLVHDRYCFKVWFPFGAIKFSVDVFDWNLFKGETQPEKIKPSDVHRAAYEDFGCFYNIKFKVLPGNLNFSIEIDPRPPRYNNSFTMLIKIDIRIRCRFSYTRKAACAAEEYLQWKELIWNKTDSEGSFENLTEGASYQLWLYETRFAYNAYRSCPRKVLQEYPVLPSSSTRRLCATYNLNVPYSSPRGNPLFLPGGFEIREAAKYLCTYVTIKCLQFKLYFQKHNKSAIEIVKIFGCNNAECLIRSIIKTQDNFAVMYLEDPLQVGLNFYHVELRVDEQEGSTFEDVPFINITSSSIMIERLCISLVNESAIEYLLNIRFSDQNYSKLIGKTLSVNYIYCKDVNIHAECNSFPGILQEESVTIINSNNSMRFFRSKILNIPNDAAFNQGSDDVSPFGVSITVFGEIIYSGIQWATHLCSHEEESERIFTFNAMQKQNCFLKRSTSTAPKLLHKAQCSVKFSYEEKVHLKCSFVPKQKFYSTLWNYTAFDCYSGNLIGQVIHGMTHGMTLDNQGTEHTVFEQDIQIFSDRYCFSINSQADHSNFSIDNFDWSLPEPGCVINFKYNIKSGTFNFKVIFSRAPSHPIQSFILHVEITIEIICARPELCGTENLSQKRNLLWNTGDWS